MKPSASNKNKIKCYDSQCYDSEFQRKELQKTTTYNPRPTTTLLRSFHDEG